MSYLLRTKRKNQTSKPFLFFVCILFFIVLALFSPLSAVMQSIAHRLGGDTLVRNILNWATSKNTLINEKKALETQIALLEVRALDRDVLFKENQTLKGIAGNKKDLLIATVLLHPGFSPYDTLVLSKGTIDAVALGDLVVFESLVIGEISEVSFNSSKATLFSTSGRTFPIKIGKNRVEAEARGLGGGSFEVLLPKNVQVDLGDKVLLAGNTPRIFGVVVDKQTEVSDAFERILFSLPININAIEFVTIEKRDL